MSQRSLGLTSATALVVANMIGAGVFSTSGFLLADLGSPWYVLAAWAVGGLQASLGAICYGALARRIPESGGEYLFLSRTLHPAAGYVAGWLSLLVGFSAPLAAAAFAFGAYARPWLGGIPPALAGSILILAFAAVHAVEVRRGAQVQNAAVLLKVTLIVAFVAFAACKIGLPAAPPDPPFPVAAFGVSLIWISFSYSGWNAAVYVAGEVRNPGKTIPRALILGTALVTLLYLGLNAVFVFSAPIAELAGKLEIGRIAARAVGGAFLEEAVAGLIALALISSVSSLVMAGPRVYAQMATDGVSASMACRNLGPPEGGHRAAGGSCPFLSLERHLRCASHLDRVHPRHQHGGNRGGPDRFAKTGRKSTGRARLPRCPLALSGRRCSHDGLHRDAKADGELRGVRHDPGRTCSVAASEEEVNEVFERISA